MQSYNLLKITILEALPNSANEQVIKEYLHGSEVKMLTSIKNILGKRILKIKEFIMMSSIAIATAIAILSCGVSVVNSKVLFNPNLVIEPALNMIGLLLIIGTIVSIFEDTTKNKKHS